MTIGRRPSIMNSQRQLSNPALPSSCDCQLQIPSREVDGPTLSMPTARKPPTPEARAFAAWKIPIRNARSVGLYQKLKYMMVVGTTPASGIPRKKRAVRRPSMFFTADIVMTMVPAPWSAPSVTEQDADLHTKKNHNHWEVLFRSKSLHQKVRRHE